MRKNKLTDEEFKSQVSLSFPGIEFITTRDKQLCGILPEKKGDTVTVTVTKLEDKFHLMLSSKRSNPKETLVILTHPIETVFAESYGKSMEEAIDKVQRSITEEISVLNKILKFSIGNSTIN